MQTITRKFLVKNIPNLSGLKKTTFKRFYIYNSNNIVIRVQDINGKYELERKSDKSELVRDEQKIEISKDEFDLLSKLCDKQTTRDSYLISEEPQTTLRIYHGDYEGLIRAEVKFTTIAESEAFKPLNWFGEEITNLPLAKEGTLLNLSKEEFNKLLN